MFDEFKVACVCILLALLGTVASTQLYYNNKNVLITEAIKSGADPLKVACALDNVSTMNPTCTLISVPK